MANNDQANSFLAMMQGTDIDTESFTEPGLPKNPKENNGQELNLVTKKWEDRPLAGENNTNTDTSIDINTVNNNLNKPVFVKPYRPAEKSKQRNFGLTDSQHHEFLQAAADYGFVRPAKGGVIEPNGSAFLQKIIELKLWEKLDQIEEGESHE